MNQLAKHLVKDDLVQKLFSKHAHTPSISFCLDKWSHW